jgi:hypothetical protein
LKMGFLSRSTMAIAPDGNDNESSGLLCQGYNSVFVSS